jgi:hypothetical protein
LLPRVKLNEFELNHLASFLNAGNFILFKLTGGLGNQLFALSEAFFLANKFNKKILLDVTGVDHNFGDSNVFLWEKYQPLHKAFYIALIDDSSFGKKIKFLNLKNSEYFEGCFFVTGWRPSYERIIASGLWLPNNLPNFFESSDEINDGTSVHIRLGDYMYVKPFAPLPWKYYKKALKIINASEDKITLISDQPDKLTTLYPKFRKYKCEYKELKSPIESMIYMTFSSKLVIGNSTFSYWSYFFGNHDKVAIPSPFYHFDLSFDKHMWNTNDVASGKILLIKYSYLAKGVRSMKNLFRRT